MTSAGTATAGSDYLFRAGVLSFGANVVSRTFTVPIVADTLDDDDESFTVNLGTPTGGATLGDNPSATVTITDNDDGGVLEFAAHSYTTLGESGSILITVKRSGGTASGVTVDYQTLPPPDPVPSGEATPYADYTPVSGTLTFASGVLTRTFSIPIKMDTLVEGPETIGLLLSNATGGASVGAQGTATVTITDDDS
jgi:hypothetical protein